MKRENQLLSRLWHDDRGSVVAAEYVMVTGLVIGAAGAGIGALRNATIKQSQQLADTITAAPYLPTPEELRQQTAMPSAKAQSTAIPVRQCNQTVNFVVLPPSP